MVNHAKKRLGERSDKGHYTHHHRNLDHDSRLKRVNARVGLKITNAVGTMWAAYVFVMLSLISLPAALTSRNPIVIVGWVAQTFLQLVLLPIIIVGQNVQAAASDKRSEDTYKDAEAVLKEAEEIQLHLKEQDKLLRGLIEKQGK